MKNHLRTVHFAVAFMVFVLDQVTKIIVARSIVLNDSITVIPGLFSISHVMNRGAAFSLFANGRSDYTRAGLVAFSAAVVMGLVFVLWRQSQGYSASSLAMALILGGALGNLYDRISLGSVIDFLAFSFGSYHWPDFNLADSAIVVGACLLILDVFRSPQEQQS